MSISNPTNNVFDQAARNGSTIVNRQAAPSDSRELVQNSGMLCYLFSVEEAKKIAGLKGPDGQPAIKFFNGTSYEGGESAVTEKSIKQVQVGDKYFVLIHQESPNEKNDNLKAGTWIETDANGTAKANGEAMFAYGGYAGELNIEDMKRGIFPNTKDGHALKEVVQGRANPQLNHIKKYVDDSIAALKAQGITPSIVHHVGHSNGGPSAAFSGVLANRKGTNSDAMLLEPLKMVDDNPLYRLAFPGFQDQAFHIAQKFGIGKDELAANTATVFTTRNGKRDDTAVLLLGGGIGRLIQVEMGGQVVAGTAEETAMKDHKAANMALASWDALTGNEPTTLREFNEQPRAGGSINLGEMLFKLIVAVLGEGDMTDMLAGLIGSLGQNFAQAGVHQSGEHTAASSGQLASPPVRQVVQVPPPTNVRQT